MAEQPDYQLDLEEWNDAADFLWDEPYQIEAGEFTIEVCPFTTGDTDWLTQAVAVAIHRRGEKLALYVTDLKGEPSLFNYWGRS